MVHPPHHESRRRSDSDELSDTASELASAIRSPYLATSRGAVVVAPPDSSLAAQAGGRGGTGGGATLHMTLDQPKRDTSVASSSALPQDHVNLHFHGTHQQQHHHHQSSNHQTQKNSITEDNAKQRSRAIVLVAVVAIVVAIVVVAVVAARSNDRKGKDDLKATLDLVIQEVSDYAALRDRDSPQYRAREWMINVDQLTAEIIQEGLYRIQQRYTLATFYFATGGGNRRWNQNVLPGQPPLDFVNPATSECHWYGIVCASSTLEPYYTGNTTDISTANTTTTTVQESTVFRLILPRRNLTGVLPPELTTLRYLDRIDLSSNQLKGTIADQIVANMNDLFWLDLSDNQLTGTIPKSLWRLPKLSHLFLYRNQLSGKIERTAESPASSSRAAVEDSLVKPLKQVYLYENQLTGTMPSWFHEMNGLDHWLAYKNQLTGPLPEQQPEQLSVYDMSSNNLTGTIPHSLWATNPPPPLETLYLEHNQLTGTIPNTTQLQPFIKFVSLHNNRLTGSLPEGFALTWTNLLKLRLQNNIITGNIPDSLWRLEQSPDKLLDLNLSYNNLSGTLPNSTIPRRNLQEVRLQMNPNLSGPIPTNFAYHWKNLSVLEIQGTGLVGQLGPTLVDQDYLSECPKTWPRYSEITTSFLFSANCYQLLRTDPDPPVRCGCCTNCPQEL